MRAAIGSQCREIKSGVTWALLGLLKTIYAAVFCRGLIAHDGSPARRPLFIIKPENGHGLDKKL